MMVNDYEIIGNILKGDKSAFRSIMDKYGNMVFNLAYTHVNNVEDARDLTQDIFFKVYKNLKKYKPEYKFFSWLYRVALNTINTYLAKRRRCPEIIPLENMGRIIEAGKDNSSAEISGAMNTVISGFKKEIREIFILFYYEDLDIKTVAGITGKTPDNIKVILHRGRNAIRNALKKEKS